MPYRRFSLFSVLLVLTGCAYLPSMPSLPKLPSLPSLPSFSGGVTTTPVQERTDTKLIRAPADWGELSRDAAYRVSQRASQVEEIRKQAIYVAEPKYPTPFALAFRQFLQSSLTEMGITVSLRPDSKTLLLDYEVQPLRLASGLQIVVTNSLGNGTRYLFRMTDVYAVNQPDVKIYDEALLPAPPAPPPPPPPPTPTKTLGVTGNL